ncbi:MAG: RNA methyltransferase [Hydrogenophilaceae bacterium]|jgi:tRNA G18 (ribose-2'-O)-methylase SpoU|nr:RNA methyltransferase [Hydrogenophilaceae bacterium]
MRGYFGVGVEEISKPMNLGALMRTAHAFGASFFFTINAAPKVREAYHADTSRSFDSVPYYAWPTLDELRLPKGCALVGVELTDEAIDLPRFKHPAAAAYVLGRERGSLSEPLQARCAHIVRIPMKFCVNVAVAGAILMYDRALSLGGYPARPLMPGGPPPEMSDKPKSKR